MLTKADIFQHNRTIVSLARHGRLDAARQLFDEMPSRDVVSWNTIITAYWKHNNIDESRRLFDAMPDRNIVSWNSMITGCVHNGQLDEAFGYFNAMPCKNVASWNAMISGFVKFGRFDDAHKLFDEMPERNVISYTEMVHAFVHKGEVEKAREVFDKMPSRNEVSWAAMISGYVECGRFEEARSLFDRMPKKNVVIKTMMITGFCKEGKLEEARSLFDSIRNKDHITWNAMLAGYVHNENASEMLNLHSQMLQAGMKQDHSTFMAVLTACSALALIWKGRQAHALTIKANLHTNISISNALINMYSKCGCISDSESVFNRMKIRDVVSWNTIISAFTQHGSYDKVDSLFHEMKAHDIVPNDITFLSVLSACGHAGKVDECLAWFNLMISRFGIKPKADHYACLVDTLSQAGQLEKACDYIREIPPEAERAVWGSLLSASQLHYHIELGQVASEKLSRLGSRNSGAYVMLSNIYARAGMWKDVNRVRILMKEHGVKKPPGCSWTEISNKIHKFMVGDASHPELNNIHFELERIGFHIKMLSDEQNKDLSTFMAFGVYW